MNRRDFLKTMSIALPALLWPTKSNKARQSDSGERHYDGKIGWLRATCGTRYEDSLSVLDEQYLLAANVHVSPVTVRLEDGRIVNIVDGGVFWLNGATMEVEDITNELTS